MFRTIFKTIYSKLFPENFIVECTDHKRYQIVLNSKQARFKSKDNNKDIEKLFRNIFKKLKGNITRTYSGALFGETVSLYPPGNFPDHYYKCDLNGNVEKVIKDYICEKCGSEKNLTRHHIVPRRLKLNINKTRHLCFDCHDKYEKSLIAYEKRKKVPVTDNDKINYYSSHFGQFLKCK